MTKVQIAYVHRTEVSHSFHHSMMALMSQSNPNIMPSTISALGYTLGLVEARNLLMGYFLDNTEASHIFFVDTDMGFKPDTVDRLLEADLDVVGALTYGNAIYAPDEMGGHLTRPFVVAYDLVQNSEGFVHFTQKELDLDKKCPQQVAATGTACLLVSREAAEKVRGQFGYAWFDQVGQTRDGKIIRNSEDLSFCYRLACVGVPIYVHTGVATTHAKMIWLQPNGASE